MNVPYIKLFASLMSGLKYSRDCSVIRKIASEIECKKDLKVLADNLKHNSTKPKDMPKNTKHNINPFSCLDDQIKS